MKINEQRRTKLVEVLADVLARLCERNDHFIRGGTPVTRFHALRPPQITIKSYLERIAKYSSCSEECFVLALIYIDRVIRKNSSFLVNSLNVHRLLITTIMLGAKFFDDQYFNNKYFGKVGGVSQREMNLLEIEFLFMINFDLFVETELYKVYDKRLMTHGSTLVGASTGQYCEKARIEVKGATAEPVADFKAATTKTEMETEVKQCPAANHQTNITQPIMAATKLSTAASGPSQALTRPSSGPLVPGARHYSTQRCTPPSPKFFKPDKRIQVEMH